MKNVRGVAEKAQGRGWQVGGICVLLLVMVLAVYGQTVAHGFINYDDPAYVYENPSATKGLSLGGIARAFTQRELGLWTPLVTISHMVDGQLFGLAAGGHHLTNVLLHAASAILLFLLLGQMTLALWRSAFVASLFAIHPLRVESVAWIAERKDILSGLFFMLTLGAYLHYLRRPGSLVRFSALIVFFALGLMCKPMLVTLPFVLLLLDYWPLKRLFRPSGQAARLNWRAVLEKIPLLALSAAFCVATMLGPKETGPIEQIPFLTRLAEAPVWYVIYLRQMIWPVGLAPIYTHPERALPWWPAALALLVALSVMSYLLRRKYPYLLTGWLWNLGMLVPVSGIVQISRHAQADHYNYLPQIGLYLGLTWLAVDWTGTWQHRRVALGAMALVVLGAFSVAAYRQTSFWRDSFSLWSHTLGCTRDNYMAHFYLGGALLQQGRKEEATSQFRETLRINPSYAEAYNNLGYVALQQGRTGEAMTLLQEALRLDPALASAHNNLGNALIGQGRTEEAMAQYREALRLSPAFADANNNLGGALLKLGRAEEAVAQFRATLRIDPTRLDAQKNLGDALLQQGRTAEAIAVLKKALERQPDNADIQNSLAWALATTPDTSLRDGARAVQLANQASESSGNNNPAILDTLAAACAAAGDFPKAVQIAERAAQLAEAAEQPALASGIRDRLKLYQAGQSYSDQEKTP